MATDTTHRAAALPVSLATRRGLDGPLLLLVTAVVATTAGGLTAYGQGRLPSGVASLANSAGPWVLVAALLALTARRATTAALTGGLALALLLAGYILTDWQRGYPSSHALIAFWSLAALLAGPVVGLASYGLRHGTRTAAAWSAGLLSGLLGGEAVYGLTVISATTSQAYWWGQLALAFVVLTTLIEVRKLAAAESLLAIGIASLTGAAFVLAYSQSLITAF